MRYKQTKPFKMTLREAAIKHYRDDLLVNDVGGMVVACPHCNALRWAKEIKTSCCSNGKVD